jgi:glycosyltransferase involved in cell wall biosynthesis
MTPNVTIIMGTYERDNLLALTLQSIARQNTEGVEVLVFNDGAIGKPEALCAQYGARCVYTGNLDLEGRALAPGVKHPWRGAVLALHLGVKLAQGEIIIMSSAEIYHVGLTCIADLIAPLAADPMALCWPCDGRGDDGRFIAHPDDAIISTLPPHPRAHDIPFFMALRREHFIAIGGFDLDMDGGAYYVDDDFMERLHLYGCHNVRTSARFVHLYHGLNTRMTPAGEKNRALMEARRGVIVRNVGRNLFGA